MNERIAKLYDQAIVIEDAGDYVWGELDPVKFAELIVKDCRDIFIVGSVSWNLLNEKLEHSGVEE